MALFEDIGIVGHLPLSDIITQKSHLLNRWLYSFLHDIQPFGLSL